MELAIPPSVAALLRPAIERDADFGGGRESKNEACRSIGRWEGSEMRGGSDMLSCIKGLLLLLRYTCRLWRSTWAADRIYGGVDVLILCVFMFVPLVLMVVRLGVPGTVRGARSSYCLPGEETGREVWIG